MNTLHNSMKRTITLTLTTLMAMSFPALASAAPVSEKDYVLFSASLRDRANGEKRFKQVFLISYGDRNLGKTYFGKRAPVPSQRISLVSEAGSITFRGTGNKGIASLDVNGDARPGKDWLEVVINGARCRVGNQKPEPCQAEIRVIRGKDGFADRIVASGSNGAEYDSGSKDGMSSLLNLPAME
jgi:hypothetical protein